MRQLRGGVKYAGVGSIRYSRIVSPFSSSHLYATLEFVLLVDTCLINCVVFQMDFMLLPCHHDAPCLRCCSLLIFPDHCSVCNALVKGRISKENANWQSMMQVRKVWTKSQISAVISPNLREDFGKLLQNGVIR